MPKKPVTQKEKWRKMIHTRYHFPLTSGHRLSGHSLRHAFSTLGGNEGTIPTVVLKQLLGHFKLSTTQKYMHELKTEQRAAMSKIEKLI
ncbi:MAG: tyrosine-type recombinase/integrase [Ktedonobacteraceae bacterium]